MQIDPHQQWTSEQFHSCVDIMVKEERKSLKGTPVRMTAREVRESCLFVILGVTRPAGNA